ncbi:MAG: hypothetical protein JJ913_10110 [Rhizobiaceae bacterium]|nr:hypothetical protein [Rhizobiaceae bacterium]
MIAAVARLTDKIFGRGEAAVTVPPLDGALRPNQMLDEAGKRFALADVDCLSVADGKLLASAGDTVFALDGRGKWKQRLQAEGQISCICTAGRGRLAVALANGEILIDGERLGGARINCPIALAEAGGVLYVASGSATNAPDDWQRDLLERNASGSLWRIDVASGKAEQIASGLAWPAGLAIDGNSIVVSEAWKHRLVRYDLANPGKPDVLYHDLPGYPGRISRAATGWWLAVFAPRSQLVEFVLREPVYRKRMLDEVEPAFWVSPKLRSGSSFYEPLQGGGVKHLGVVKPWAPAMSAGLSVRLDEAFQPVASLQSRADGSTHGVTSVLEHDGQVYVAARGDGVVVRLPTSAGGRDR